MTFNPLAERGLPLDRQLRSWSELNGDPYDSREVHPYTRCRVILMNGVEVEAADVYMSNLAAWNSGAQNWRYESR